MLSRVLLTLELTIIYKWFRSRVRLAGWRFALSIGGCAVRASANSSAMLGKAVKSRYCPATVNAEELNTMPLGIPGKAFSSNEA